MRQQAQIKIGEIIFYSELITPVKRLKSERTGSLTQETQRTQQLAAEIVNK